MSEIMQFIIMFLIVPDVSAAVGVRANFILLLDVSATSGARAFYHL